MTPTARSLQECKRLGWRAQSVEKWIPQAKRRVDLFSFIDIVAITECGILGIQATGGQGGNAAARVRKIQTECRDAASDWLGVGGLVEVWGWALRGARGERKTYTLKRYPITKEMLSNAANQDAE